MVLTSRNVSRKWPPSGCGSRSSSRITSAAVMRETTSDASEAIFALADLRKHFPWRAFGKTDGFCDFRHVGAQKRILSLFRADRCRHGGLAGSKLLRDFRGAGGERLVVRLDGFGEADIGVGIFVAAIEPGVVGQTAQLEQGLPHH